MKNVRTRAAVSGVSALATAAIAAALWFASPLLELRREQRIRVSPYLLKKLLTDQRRRD